MKKIIQKIVLITIMLLITLVWNSSNLKVYASSEAEELKSMLDLYKTEMGDLKQFKEVVDKVYNDLYSADKVDEALKTKLIEDINKLYEIDGMNPVIAQALVTTLEEQVNSLNEDTLPELQEEISVIKEWADAQQTTESDPEPTPTPTPDANPTPDAEPTPDSTPTPTPTPTPTTSSDDSTAGKDIPKAGITNVIITVLVIAIITIAIIAKHKYGYLKDI